MDILKIFIENNIYEIDYNLLYEKGGTYWKCLFNSGMKEAHNKEVTIKDFNIRILELYIKFIKLKNYCIMELLYELEEVLVEEDNIIELYCLAHYFACDNLIFCCVMLITRYMERKDLPIFNELSNMYPHPHILDILKHLGPTILVQKSRLKMVKKCCTGIECAI